MSYITPKKRSVSELQHVSPTQAAATRKPVSVYLALVADGTVAIIMPVKEGRPHDEPFTNPARVALSQDHPDNQGMNVADNPLKRGGFFAYATAVVFNTIPEVPLRTSRGYDYKYYLASCDVPMTEEDLRRIGNIFVSVRIIYDVLCLSIFTYGFFPFTLTCATLSSQYMNSSRQNRYELYSMPKDWNKTPNGATQATRYITTESVNRVLKML